MSLNPRVATRGLDGILISYHDFYDLTLNSLKLFGQCLKPINRPCLEEFFNWGGGAEILRFFSFLG